MSGRRPDFWASHAHDGNCGTELLLDVGGGKHHWMTRKWQGPTVCMYVCIEYAGPHAVDDRLRIAVDASDRLEWTGEPTATIGAQFSIFKTSNATTFRFCRQRK